MAPHEAMKIPVVLFHCAPIPLAEGSVIEPGNWGRVVQLELPRTPAWPLQCAKELILEHARLHLAPQAPSRLSCAFACRTLEEATMYRNANAPANLIYSVSYEAGAAYHLCEYACYNQIDLNQSFSFLQRVISGYWSPAAASRTVEVLIASTLTIIGRAA